MRFWVSAQTRPARNQSIGPSESVAHAPRLLHPVFAVFVQSMVFVQNETLVPEHTPFVVPFAPANAAKSISSISANWSSLNTTRPYASTAGNAVVIFINTFLVNYR
jgi:hypothetical protein